MNEEPNYGKDALISVIGMTLLLSFFLGIMVSFTSGKCEKTSIASYFPSYWMGCELFEKRWEATND